MHAQTICRSEDDRFGHWRQAIVRHLMHSGLIGSADIVKQMREINDSSHQGCSQAVKPLAFGFNEVNKRIDDGTVKSPEPLALDSSLLNVRNLRLTDAVDHSFNQRFFCREVVENPTFAFAGNRRHAINRERGQAFVYSNRLCGLQNLVRGIGIDAFSWVHNSYYTNQTV